MPHCLPNELLVDIIEFLFEELEPRATESSPEFLTVKPTWNRIQSVVLASRFLREVGLRLWFTHLRVKKEWDWEIMSSIPGIYDWVKVITYYNLTSILIPDIHPRNFRFLEGVSFRMFDVDRPIRVIKLLPQSVKYLELWKFDTMVHKSLFPALTASLPELRELRLHGMTEMDKYGLGTHFPSADAFGLSLAKSLCSLQKLEVLAMDVYLIPSTVPLYHASCPVDLALSSCDICLQKFNHEANANEIDVSLILVNSLGSLKRIEWCSCFSPGCRSVILIERESGENGTVFILKRNI